MIDNLLLVFFYCSLFVCFFVFAHISIRIFTFLIVCLILVFMILIFFRKLFVLYGVFDSFTDCPYGNAFLFVTYNVPSILCH